MQSAFDILVKVNCSHSYFYDGIFSGFSIKVTDGTNKILQNHDLIMRPFNGGFYILYDQNFAGTTRTREDVLNETLTLDFTLILTDPLFYNYTADAPVQIDQSIYFFNNSLNLAGSLHTDDFVSENDVQPLTYFTEQFFVKPFAKLILALNSGLQNEYTIKFNAKSTYWRYILMSNYLQELNNPAIIDADSTNAFGIPAKVNLPGNLQVNAFTSGDALPLSQRPAKAFQLAENYETSSSKYRVVIRSLPYPDISAISRLPNSSSNFSDIFIY
ncbi:hypothetical protein HDF19_11305 [Mucilaginibacter sp. E4BP6]|uniref:hypothetical protein n=1 Tax=Mucilaginibacter sp. E4BP6 TaxID=2723089 RepID=UPI0015CCF7CA|nr:hypothetical protein [Mucilaginibacter sp. E4BP6]NYE65255.1 hypothetical protein [Mucilaginibacter sp. E4BP6]